MSLACASVSGGWRTERSGRYPRREQLKHPSVRRAIQAVIGRSVGYTDRSFSPDECYSVQCLPHRPFQKVATGLLFFGLAIGGVDFTHLPSFIRVVHDETLTEHR